MKYIMLIGKFLPITTPPPPLLLTTLKTPSSWKVANSRTWKLPCSSVKQGKRRQQWQCHRACTQLHQKRSGTPLPPSRPSESSPSQEVLVPGNYILVLADPGGVCCDVLVEEQVLVVVHLASVAVYDLLAAPIMTVDCRSKAATFPKTRIDGGSVDCNINAKIPWLCDIELELYRILDPKNWFDHDKVPWYVLWN